MCPIYYLYHKKLNYFNKSLERDPNDAEFLGRRGVTYKQETYQELEKYNEAQADINNLLNKDPNDILALRSQGETFQKLKKYNEALTDFNNLLELEPNNALTLRLRGETYQKLENYNEALTNFNNLLKKRSK
ncbi:hypothetical protein Glove_94g53 [Diversispora epigaea]|uniref:Uncharacterized protein n=1 Tax=Diversispora epigaea TaxID=1348612 RepID=A0A397J7G8_9GLOM|nr:hypothetical protein Glove_94g53 [Diversispora epigaea]